MRITSKRLSGIPRYLLCWPVVVCAGVLTAIASMFFQTSAYWWLAIAPVAFSFFMLCRSIPDTETKPGSPWPHLFVENANLNVNQYCVPVRKVTVVFLHRQQERAVLQLPFNHTNGHMPEIQFSAMYFPAVETFLQLRIPGVKIYVLPSIPVEEPT